MLFLVNAMVYEKDAWLKRLWIKVVFWLFLSLFPYTMTPISCLSISGVSQSLTDVCPVPSFLLRKYKALAEMKCGFPSAGHERQNATVTANGPWDVFFDNWFYSFTPVCIWVSLVSPLRTFRQLQPWQIYNIALAMAVNDSSAFLYGYVKKAMRYICWAT